MTPIMYEIADMFTGPDSSSKRDDTCYKYEL